MRTQESCLLTGRGEGSVHLLRNEDIELNSECTEFAAQCTSTEKDYTLEYVKDW